MTRKIALLLAILLPLAAMVYGKEGPSQTVTGSFLTEAKKVTVTPARGESVEFYFNRNGVDNSEYFDDFHSKENQGKTVTVEYTPIYRDDAPDVFLGNRIDGVKFQ